MHPMYLNYENTNCYSYCLRECGKSLVHSQILILLLSDARLLRPIASLCLNQRSKTLPTTAGLEFPPWFLTEPYCWIIITVDRSGSVTAERALRHTLVSSPSPTPSVFKLPSSLACVPKKHKGNGAVTRCPAHQHPQPAQSLPLEAELPNHSWGLGGSAHHPTNLQACQKNNSYCWLPLRSLSYWYSSRWFFMSNLA